MCPRLATLLLLAVMKTVVVAAAPVAGRRSLQHRAGGKACGNLDDRTAALNAECCDEPSEDCGSGRPATCNLGCAHVLLPFFEDCAGALGPTAAERFDGVVRLCHAAEPPAPVRIISMRWLPRSDVHA